jgi:hypothetical protein
MSCSMMQHVRIIPACCRLMELAGLSVATATAEEYPVSASESMYTLICSIILIALHICFDFYFFRGTNTVGCSLSVGPETMAVMV